MKASKLPKTKDSESASVSGRNLAISTSISTSTSTHNKSPKSRDFLQIEKVTLFKGAKGELFGTEKEAQESILSQVVFNALDNFLLASDLSLFLDDETDVATFMVANSEQLELLLNHINKVKKGEHE